MRVFVSYCRRDEKMTDEVCRELESRGHEIWRDVTSIPGGAVWRASIEKGIADSDVFVMLLSPAVVESPDYAREELDCARGFDKPIIPVYLAAVPKLPGGFTLTLSGRQRVDLFPSFAAGVERLVAELGGTPVPVAPSRRKLELRGWAADNAARVRTGVHHLRREAKQRDLGRKALKIGGVVAAGAAAAAAAAARSRAAAERDELERQQAGADAALVAYRRKVNDIIERCASELGRLVGSSEPEAVYEREFRPALRFVLGRLDGTEAPPGLVPDHRRLVESLTETLDHLDRAFLELQRGDDEGARRALERMAEQFVKTLQAYGEVLSS